MYRTKNRIWKGLQREEGITALETAIILIAFVVVASVFAFTILSAGNFSTERGKEAIYAGLQEVRSSVELKGSVIAIASAAGVSETVDSLVFSLGSNMSGQAIDLNTDNRIVVIEYRDATQRQQITDWTVTWLVRKDTDDLLEPGELAEITVPLDALTTGLGVNTEFSVEVKPPTGAVLNLQRLTPAYIDAVNDLQ